MSQPSTYAGLLIALLVVSPTSLMVQATESQRTRPSRSSRLSSQSRFRSSPPSHGSLSPWVRARFDAAGLSLPEVVYVFHDNLEECGGHGGTYSPSTRTVTMCNQDPKTLIHELAHAWETTSLSDEMRADFAELRGLKVWHDHSVPWAERAAEQVAEVITWGVEEGSRLVRWTERYGAVTFKLLSIDASVDELLAAYKLLTGAEPVLRNPEEWHETEWNDFSPELARLSG